MKVSDFIRLKKLMQLTTSASDPEALGAMRKANEILSAYAIDWDRVLSRTVTVVNEFEAAPEEDPNQNRRREKAEVDEAFAAVEASDPRGSFADFIASLKDQWETRGRLTDLQKDALFKAARRS